MFVAGQPSRNFRMATEPELDGYETLAAEQILYRLLKQQQVTSLVF
jgi:hypothetical protein